MTIATTYLEDAGETVGQACERLAAAGVPMNAAATQIGYYSSSDLRKYLERRGLNCPWPKDLQRRRGHPPARVTGAQAEHYATQRAQGVPPLQAAEGTGHTPAQIRNAIKRRPDLRLPLGKRKGDPWRLQQTIGAKP